MEEVFSRDGTPIAYECSGSGPPLVLVHGTTANHERWRPIQGPLERHFTLYAIDRRGYGGSGDAEPYAIEREFEDIAALVDAIGEPVNLLGHSYGALCALGATLLTSNLRKLVLYEPAISTGARMYPREVVDRMQALLDAGDRDGVVTTMFRDLAGMSPAEIERLRAQPFWQVRVAAAHLILRETYAEEGYRLDPAKFKKIRVPTLLLLGGDSPALFRTSTKAANRALPNSRVIVLKGQQHIAMNTAPELFLREVTNFLKK
jgi:pimeloyl-ACP methyl ester carboxylesterase